MSTDAETQRERLVRLARSNPYTRRMDRETMLWLLAQDDDADTVGYLLDWYLGTLDFEYP